MKKILIASMSVALIALGGCVHTMEHGNSALANESYETLTNSVVKGKTTKAELLERFGTPTSRSNSPIDGSEVWTWQYMGTSVRQDGRVFIPVVGGFIGANSQTENRHVILTVTFKGDVVSQVTVNESGSSGGLKHFQKAKE